MTLQYKTQSDTIKSEIIKCLDGGIDNKNEIYSNVVNSLKVPRPTVRRVTMALLAELEDKVQILKSDMKQTNIMRRKLE